jgi:hypothetical protein
VAGVKPSSQLAQKLVSPANAPPQLISPIVPWGLTPSSLLEGGKDRRKAKNLEEREMIEYISTKDTAKLVRVALRNAFPGMKFSVRMSTGTAAAWMNVSWDDGPTTREVDAIAGLYEGRKFNGSTDGYDDAGTVLVAFDGEQMPREVRYSCDGINTHRDYTAAGYQVAQHLISTDSNRKDLVIFTPDGAPISGGVIPPDIWVAGHFYDYVYGPTDLARMILHHVNLCVVDQASK